MATKKLDRARDYAVIVGDTEGRVYEQDHLYFTGEGLEWVDPAKPAKALRAPKATAPIAAVDDQVARQLSSEAQQAGD